VSINVDACGPPQHVKDELTERFRSCYVAESTSYSAVSSRIESLFQIEKSDDRSWKDLRRGCEFEDLAQSDHIVNKKTA
jgi:hypothetical protein